jgi:hypothetical protein
LTYKLMMKDRTVNRYSVCGGVLFGRGEGEQIRWRWGNTVDGLHILTQSRSKTSLAIALSEAERESRGRDSEGDLINVPCKPIQICHYGSPLYEEYILKKKKYRQCDCPFKGHPNYPGEETRVVIGLPVMGQGRETWSMGLRL